MPPLLRQFLLFSHALPKETDNYTSDLKLYYLLKTVAQFYFIPFAMYMFVLAWNFLTADLFAMKLFVIR